jgi:hypothetical protein
MRACRGAVILLALSAPATAQNLVFEPLPPCRIVDTSLGGQPGAITAGVTRHYVVRGVANYAAQGGFNGSCGIPANAGAVAINVVAKNPQGRGNLLAFPSDVTPAASASTLNFQNLSAVGGLNIANGVIVDLCTGTCATGHLGVQARLAATDVIIDVTGYFRVAHAPFEVVASNWPYGLKVVSTDDVFGFGADLQLDATAMGGRSYSLISTGPGGLPGANRLGIYDNAASLYRMVLTQTGRVCFGSDGCPGSRGLRLDASACSTSDDLLELRQSNGDLLLDVDCFGMRLHENLYLTDAPDVPTATSTAACIDDSSGRVGRCNTDPIFPTERLAELQAANDALAGEVAALRAELRSLRETVEAGRAAAPPAP